MEKILNIFLDYLDKKYNFLTTYLQTLENQAKVVVGGNVNQINDNLNYLSKLVEKNRDIESIREKYIHELSSCLKISNEDLTLTNIITKLNGEKAEKFLQYKNKLMFIIPKIKLQLETNKFIIEYASNFTHEIIRLSNKAMNSDLVYSKDGAKNERADQKKIMDQKV